MFLTELSPAIQELTRQPIAFLGGFFSGVFRLKLEEEPLKTWLEKQGVDAYQVQTKTADNNGRPQSIAID
jgi:hypothetical protein